MVRLRLAPDLPPMAPAIGAACGLFTLFLLTPSLLALILGLDPWTVRKTLSFLGISLLPGLLLWPVFFRILGHFPDRGFSFSLALGPYILSYLVYLLARMGLGFTQVTLGVGLGMMVMGGAISGVSQFRGMTHEWRVRWKRPCTVLIAGWIAFSAVLLLRTQTPTISFHSSEASGPTIADVAAEKFTDFTILNNLMTTPILPPEDTWVSGTNLNYYYFGHLTYAVLGRLTGVPPEITYNLSLAIVAMLSAIAAAGAALCLGRGLSTAAILGAFLLLAAGNMDSILQSVTLVLGSPEGSFLTTLPRSGPWWKYYDFWRPSRAVENTITEFPAFSFLLGDLHAHVLAIPVLISGISCIFQLGLLVRRYPSLLAFQRDRWEQVLLISWVLGALSATNSWDALTLTALLATVIWLAGRRPGWLSAVEAILLSVISLVLGAKGFFLSYSSEFTSPFPPVRLVSGDGLLPSLSSSPIGWVRPGLRSGVDEYLAHWGWLCAPIAAFSWYSMRRLPQAMLWSNLAVFGLTMGLFYPLLGSLISSAMGAALTTLIWAIVRAGTDQRLHRGLLVLILPAMAMLLITEIAYLDDIFGSPIDRINTVFKVWYGVWPILGLASIMALMRLGLLLRGKNPVLLAGLVLVYLVPMAIYPGAGLSGRLRLSAKPPIQTSLDSSLDGLDYLRRERPDDYTVALYLAQRGKSGVAILEAAGSQYSYAGRMATLSGKPVFAGWLNHSLGWRGERFTEERDRRTSVTAAIYQGNDGAETFRLLAENRIGYIVIGDLERRTYPALSEKLLRKLSHPIVQTSSTVLLEFIPESVSLSDLFVEASEPQTTGPASSVTTPEAELRIPPDADSAATSTPSVNLDTDFGRITRD